jgi:hypothetical protein
MHHPLAEVGAYNAPLQQSTSEVEGGKKEGESFTPMELFKDLVILGKEEFDYRLGKVLAETRQLQLSTKN